MAIMLITLCIQAVLAWLRSLIRSNSYSVHDEFISKHPLTQQLRSMKHLRESRPHLDIPPGYRVRNLTCCALIGPGRIEAPPFAWHGLDGGSYLQICYLGSDLCSFSGIIHGGLLATILDEGMARCCVAALPHNIGMTASLNICYKVPVRAEQYVVLQAFVTKVEGRKAWVTGRLETLVDANESPVVLVDAQALFISPRTAAVCHAFVYMLQLQFADGSARLWLHLDVFSSATG